MQDILSPKVGKI